MIDEMTFTSILHSEFSLIIKPSDIRKIKTDG